MCLPDDLVAIKYLYICCLFSQFFGHSFTRISLKIIIFAFDFYLVVLALCKFTLCIFLTYHWYHQSSIFSLFVANDNFHIHFKVGVSEIFFSQWQYERFVSPLLKPASMVSSHNQFTAQNNILSLKKALWKLLKWCLKQNEIFGVF